MSRSTRRTMSSAGALALAASAIIHAGQTPDGPRQGPPFRFSSGVEVVNVTATVSDANGRFVSGLTQDDFEVYEDDEQQAVTHFSAERVPVSLGIVLDTSGSMAGEKIQEAQGALARFLGALQDPADEFFLYRFSNSPLLLQDWTRDRQTVTRALGRLSPSGGTAMYDAVDEAIPLTNRGTNQKKALLIISDGNDTTSRGDAAALKRRIRETDVLVYAVGIDGDAEDTFRPARPRGTPGLPPVLPPGTPRMPIPIPLPFPGGGRRPGGRFDVAPQARQAFGGNGDRVNAAALRDLTDDSGGRTEIVREARDLNPATTSIADELSKQYYLAYPATGKKDGRWHPIRVEVRKGPYHVRARRGYMAP